MQITLNITDPNRPNQPKLSKANARDVRVCRQHLQVGNVQAYASGMAGIHRSSSRPQQREIEAAIIADDMAGVFYRHPTNGCMMAHRNVSAATREEVMREVDAWISENE